MAKLALVLALAIAVLLPAIVLGMEDGSLGPKGRLVSKTIVESKWVPNKETGKLEEVKTERKKLFQIVLKKTSMPDPLDPSKSITVDVPTEVPYKPNKRAKGRIGKLKKKFRELRKREFQLKQQLRRARSTNKVDFPVLEDGAPARPNRQERKMRQQLYEELEATQFPKAKNIKEDVIAAGRTMLTGSGAARQELWNWFDDVKDEPLVPKHGWSMHM